MTDIPDTFAFRENLARALASVPQIKIPVDFDIDADELRAQMDRMAGPHDAS